MFKKHFGVILALTIALCMAGCEDVEPTEPGVTGSHVTTAPSGDSGGVDPGVTEPDTTGPATPADPIVPTDPSEPTGPVDPVDPTDPMDPTEPTAPDAPDHQHFYTEKVTKATCTEDGYTTYTCECGEAYQGKVTPATGHSWGDWITVNEPTEASTGNAERTCSACGSKDNKVLDKLIPNHTHSYTAKVTTKATCSKEGVKTFSCSCGSAYTEAIAKTNHRYSQKEVWPTCYAPGYMTYTCRDCGYSYKGSYKDIVDHSYCWETIPPTCTENGYTLFMCDYCLGYYYEDITPAIGHSFGNYSSNGDATCTKDGTKTATCSNGCGTKDTVTDTGSAKGHSYTVTATREPSMTIEGYTTYTCSNCGDSYKDNFVPVIPQEEFERMVAEATVKYINQFRMEQGDTAAISLPGLTLVAEYRAVQLQTNFSHSTEDLREAYAYYQYGEWVDGTLYGGTQQYYTAHAKEAIIDGGGGVADADGLGYRFAEVLFYSPNHWSYVGSSKYPYIGVGATWSLNGWCICVLQTVNNYG